MASPSSSDSGLSMNTILHLITNRLSSSNYLLWRNQLLPLLAYQNLLPHVDGTSSAPPIEILSGDKTAPNPAYDSWLAADQRTVILLQASLSEEAFSEIVGLQTARQIWVALEAAYSNSSVERIQNLRDQLRLLSKGSSTVSEFARKFRSLCDQLSAIGHPVEDSDKLHWFLCGLGAPFETFSTAIRASRTPINFRDLLAQAEGHELFLRSIHGSVTPPVAFSAAVRSNPDRGGRTSRGGRGRGRRPPQCQLCRTPGHYANACPQLATFVSRAPASSRPPAPPISPDADLAQAFHAQCHVTTSGPDWYADTGATDHMTSSAASVTHPAPFSGPDKVVFGNGTTLPISHIGQSSLGDSIRLRDVLVVPAITKNLLSVSKLTSDNPLDVLFSHPHFYIQDRVTKRVLAQGRCEDGLYVLTSSPKALFASTKSSLKASFELWHARLGHVSFNTILLLNKLGRLSVTSLLPNPGVCSSCNMAKAHRLPFVLNEKRALHVLDLIHCDLWGPSPVCSVESYRYYVTFVDDHSRFTWFYPLKTKSEFYNVLNVFLKYVQTQFSSTVKVFQSDGGAEFLNHHVRDTLNSNGTLHRVSCPYTPQQNGRAERKHRHIVETGLAMLFTAHVSPDYWVHAFSSAVYVISRLPSTVLKNQSPFELLFNSPPSYAHFRPFGCRVYPYLRDYAANKLSPRSLPCVFLGYCSRYKGFKCLEPSTSRIYITRHARFDESCFPFNGPTASTHAHLLSMTRFSDDSLPTPVSQPSSPPVVPVSVSPPSSPPCGLCDEVSGSPPVPPPATTSPASATTPSVSSPPSATPDAPSTFDSGFSSPAVEPSPQPSGHPMMTRAKAGIFKPKHRADLAHLTSYGLLSALHASTDPKGFKTAARHPHWQAAMQQEMDALRRNSTWTLVPRPTNHNVVGCKWLFRTKYLADGSIDRHKARLVAQGFSQIPGLDFAETFSPVVKATTVRTVLSLAVANRWNLHQLDVNNAFLHGNLSELVFMEQPPGFRDDDFPDHVCRLNKALYGLKQAPRSWFHRLSTFLLSNGFVCSRADPSLFVFKRGSCILYLLVYVDDLILTGNEEPVIRSFINQLHCEFSIKDLGRLNFFLGLEVSYTTTGLFLGQSKYAHDILQRANMLDAKPVSTPLAANIAFVADGDPFDDPTYYRSLVGALQYLTITRPDISYAVNQVSQFLQAPSVAHFQSVKRILRYIKGTLTFGLTFARPKAPVILGYSDADWARCLETRRSTYGYSIFLGGNLVSWSAKKQPTVSRSSCESEYRAMANTAAEIVWLTHLLRELHALPSVRPTLLCDNKSALFLSQNPVSHKRAKHIDLDYHFIRELVASGKLRTKFVPTKLQVADIFTKSLPRHQFEFFRGLLNIGPPPFRLRGDIRHT
ncbi:hypothetical protein L1887_22027 [Cichorium endivia]|nr:hypothetical protein L1887_22027 [Cichorium endivia]